MATDGVGRAESRRPDLDGKIVIDISMPFKQGEPGERERFRETAESELLSLHEGNFARYQIRPSEFAAWQEAWNR